MLRTVLLSLLGACLLVVSGCALSSMGSQSWSDNYALMPGVQCTAAAMVDGDLKTIGETTLPEGAEDAYGMSGTQETVVTLPEVQNVYRVVVHSENIKTFKILADKGGGNWELIKDVKAVTASPIDERVSARTDKIRIRVLATSDDGELRRTQSARGNFGRSRRGSRVAAGKIAEIEIYGYADEGAVAAEEESKKAEETLDQLLAQ